MARYKAIPQGYMTVGEVAKKMGVTVRALQYYDREGLFSPSCISEGGRRLYSDKDIVKLHQILTLKKVYKANGAPIWFGVISQFISSFIHTLICCLIVFALSPLIFKAELPPDLIWYFLSLIALLAITLAIGCIFGLLIKQQAKLTMVAMAIFLPSTMLSGIMFPADMLPQFMQYIAYAFPATIAFKAMTSFQVWHLPVLFGIFILLCGVIALLLKIKVKR